ncbi:MAG: hypothetical protein AAB731_01530 [Patescibacteria group bacterium]
MLRTIKFIVLGVLPIAIAAPLALFVDLTCLIGITIITGALMALMIEMKHTAPGKKHRQLLADSRLALIIFSASLWMMFFFLAH